MLKPKMANHFCIRISSGKHQLLAPRCAKYIQVHQHISKPGGGLFLLHSCRTLGRAGKNKPLPISNQLCRRGPSWAKHVNCKSVWYLNRWGPVLKYSQLWMPTHQSLGPQTHQCTLTFSSGFCTKREKKLLSSHPHNTYYPDSLVSGLVHLMKLTPLSAGCFWSPCIELTRSRIVQTQSFRIFDSKSPLDPEQCCFSSFLWFLRARHPPCWF